MYGRSGIPLGSFRYLARVLSVLLSKHGSRLLLAYGWASLHIGFYAGVSTESHLMYSFMNANSIGYERSSYELFMEKALTCFHYSACTWFSGIWWWDAIHLNLGRNT